MSIIDDKFKVIGTYMQSVQGVSFGAKHDGGVNRMIKNICIQAAAGDLGKELVKYRGLNPAEKEKEIPKEDEERLIALLDRVLYFIGRPEANYSDALDDNMPAIADLVLENGEGWVRVNAKLLNEIESFVIPKNT